MKHLARIYFVQPDERFTRLQSSITGQLFYLLNLVKEPKANHCLAGLDFLLRDQSYRHTVRIVLESILEWHSYLYATDCIELDDAIDCKDVFDRLKLGVIFDKAG